MFSIKKEAIKRSSIFGCNMIIKRMRQPSDMRYTFMNGAEKDMKNAVKKAHKKGKPITIDDLTKDHKKYLIEIPEYKQFMDKISISVKDLERLAKEAIIKVI